MLLLRHHFEISNFFIAIKLNYGAESKYKRELTQQKDYHPIHVPMYPPVCQALRTVYSQVPCLTLVMLLDQL